MTTEANCPGGRVVAPHHDHPVITGTANVSARRATGVPK